MHPLASLAFIFAMFAIVILYYGEKRWHIAAAVVFMLLAFVCCVAGFLGEVSFLVS